MHQNKSPPAAFRWDDNVAIRLLARAVSFDAIVILQRHMNNFSFVTAHWFKLNLFARFDCTVGDALCQFRNGLCAAAAIPSCSDKISAWRAAIIFFETLGATFGATLAGCLALIVTTGAAVYFFMKRKKVDDSDPIQQMQTILYEEIHRVRELVTIRKPFKREVPVNDDKKIPKTNVHMPFSDRKILITYHQHP